MTEIKVPTLGESVSEATVATWLVKEGDAVTADQPIIELETDKVTLEVNAPTAGVISKIIVSEGESVEVDALLGEISAGGAATAASNDAPKAEIASLAPSGSGEIVDVKVPTLGESVSEATVATWLVKEGDAITVDQPMAELETDKVTLEVNAPAAGVVNSITVAEGDSVTVDAVLGTIAAGTSAGSVSTPAQTTAAPQAAASTAPASDAIAMPAAEKMINDNKLDASKIIGTGKDGRILKEDVQNFMNSGGASKAPAPTVAKALAATPAPSYKMGGDSRDVGVREEKVKMSRLRQKIAERLKNAQNTAAMLTTFNEVDMSAVMNLRKMHQEKFVKKHDIKLGFMSFFVKAAVLALREFPAVNAEISGTDIIYKNYYDIGCAVSTPQGLVVPVIREADSMNFAGIEKTIFDLGTRARDGKLSIDEMMGGTFTITNGGTFGSMLSTPILNAPQSAILGMHNIVKRAVVMPDGSIEARPMMYLALSYDHRIIDGREAVSSLVRIKEAIENPERLLLDI